MVATFFLKPVDISETGENFLITKAEIKPQYDKFKDENVDRLLLTLSHDGRNDKKIFAVQNKINSERLSRNFNLNIEENPAGLEGKEIGLYRCEICVKGKVTATIRVKVKLNLS